VSTPSSPLMIPARFRGPAESGNGGWTAGALASYLAPGPVTVRLSAPPPLETPLPVTVEDDAARAVHDGAPVLTATPATGPIDAVEFVDPIAARSAEPHYAGHASHPFPTCFSCGTDRAEGDGLRIFPGRVTDDAEGRVRVAATWTPHPSLGGDRASLPVMWAALDCAGAWAGDLGDRVCLLGTMSAEVLDLPRIGEEHVVVGGARGEDGRKLFTCSSVYTLDQRLLGHAEHVWIQVG